MSEMELLLIGLTMILATGMVRCLEGIYHSMRSPQRFWMPEVLLWVTFIYGLSFLWSYRNDLSILSPSYPLYAGSILAASAFFLRAHILATKDAARVKDWVIHFHDSARSYFLVSILGTLSTILARIANGDTTGYDAVAIPFWMAIGINAMGAIFEKTWVRGTVVILLALNLALGTYFLIIIDKF